MPQRYRPQEVVRVLEYLGWKLDRQRGSHAILNKAGQPGVVAVPLSRREVPVGTFSEILREAGLTRREFDAAAREVL